MLNTLPEAPAEEIAIQIVQRALGVHPLRASRQNLSESGKAVYRIDLPDEQSVALRTSDRPSTFAFTPTNLDVLRALGLPVQSVLAKGPLDNGGSFIILNWLAGRDLLHEIGGMTRPAMTRLAEQVVDYQRRLAQLPPAQRFGWAPIGRNGNLQKWTHVFGEPAPSTTVDDPSPPSRLRARLAQLRRQLEPYFETVRPTPFLDDLTTKNLLVENGHLTGIIDVDFICYGDPLLSIGATMASLAADAPPSCRFYGEELIRCWNPNLDQRRAVWFYAALWAFGFLQMTDATAQPHRAQSLHIATETWLEFGLATPDISVFRNAI